MHTEQIDRTRDRIRDLARTASHAEEYRQGMLRLVGEVVPWDGAVLTALDPATHLVTAATLLDLDSSRCATAIEIELAECDGNLYTALARQTPGVAVLSHAVGGDMARSARYRDLYRPAGLHDELRAVARAGGSCWGALSLARRPGHNFTDDDIAALATLEGAIADGLRVMLLRAVGAAASDRQAAGPAVIVLDSAGEVESCTAEALDLLAGLSWREVDLPALLLPVRSAAARLRRGSRDVAGVRLHAVDGSWLLLHAAPLCSTNGTSRTVVTIEPARPPEVVSIVAAVIGLTARETEVLEHLLAGHTSIEIGRKLYLSPYTVNDHVQHIFDKAGVRNRKELMTWLFFSHYSQGA
ncbi:Transcriptional regulator, LuxR family [Alloactinosynnema sp. L-07]|uniref:helix-turn-helix transcriptional regulator n=1 Tax=Alloactinosynnema sp. L-07 TaxID=1653480 RepID=UPI00065F06AC|nr:LuxR C-terminal-related transcriptional regulator [Alloactinosynnema sp. L-07]CRK57132.1 Transcriptional regulator, LuxR family [Alloactinosynnema sp. L-07]